MLVGQRSVDADEQRLLDESVIYSRECSVQHPSRGARCQTPTTATSRWSSRSPAAAGNKYEIDDDGVTRFDRRLGGPVGFPGDYGYVVGADGEDGDALDALVLLDEATFPGVHIGCRVIGAFLLQVGEDPHQDAETKLICVPEHDHHQDHLEDIDDLPANFREELSAFFEAYRMLEPGAVRVLEPQSRERALEALRTARG